MTTFKTWLLRGLLAFLGLVVIVVVAFVVWGSTPLGPSEVAMVALKSDDLVTVTAEPWLTFAPADRLPTAGLIFYPGGRVDPRSYASLARSIAAEGVLVVVVPMPLNLAVFAPDRAADVIAAHPEVTTWALGGHSLGGAMAARYAFTHENGVEGLVLWASYPASTDDLSSREDLAALSIYGTRDGLMTQDEVDMSRSLVPAQTCWVAIGGGNHAQFGDYGVQGGDNPAHIPAAAQHAQIVSATVAFVQMLAGMSEGSVFGCSGIGNAQ